MIPRVNVLFFRSFLKRAHNVAVDIFHYRKHGQIYLRRFVRIEKRKCISNRIKQQPCSLQQKRMAYLLILFICQHSIADHDFERIRRLTTEAVHIKKIVENTAKPRRVFFMLHPCFALLYPRFKPFNSLRIISKMLNQNI